MQRALFVLTCFLVGGWFVWSDGNIAADIGLRSQNLSPALIVTSERRCKSNDFFFQNCRFKYQVNGADRKLNYYFFAMNSPERLVMLQSRYSGQVTSNVGQEYLLNRILTAVAFPLIGLFFLLKGSRQARGEPVLRAAEARQPVIIESDGFSKRNFDSCSERDFSNT